MINKRLKVLRLLAGVSQEQVAKKCGFSRTKLSFLETGRQPLQDDDREKIAGALAKALDTDPERIVF
jgi:transcriptional regulator with XRE-family HTH domain